MNQEPKSLDESALDAATLIAKARRELDALEMSMRTPEGWEAMIAATGRDGGTLIGLRDQVSEMSLTLYHLTHDITRRRRSRKNAPFSVLDRLGLRVGR